MLWSHYFVCCIFFMYFVCLLLRSQCDKIMINKDVWSVTCFVIKKVGSKASFYLSHITQ